VADHGLSAGGQVPISSRFVGRFSINTTLAFVAGGASSHPEYCLEALIFGFRAKMLTPMLSANCFKGGYNADRSLGRIFMAQRPDALMPSISGPPIDLVEHIQNCDGSAWTKKQRGWGFSLGKIPPHERTIILDSAPSTD
jgi:hypothetical protein